MCSVFFCEDRIFFWNDDQKISVDCLKLLLSQKILVGFLFLTGLLKKTQTLSNGKTLMPPRLELGTFSVLGRCDNKYSMAPMRLYRF